MICLCALLGVRSWTRSANLCYLTYIFIIIIFAPLSLGQYLDYIENVDVKSFVLVSIELVLLEFTFRCTV